MSVIHPSANARAWLPPSAIVALKIDDTLAEVARGWSRKWFARATVRPLETLSADSPPSAEPAEWHTLGADLAVGTAEAGTSALSALMFGEDLPENPPTAADIRLLSDLAQACLDDLCRRLAHAVRLDAAAPWNKGGADAPPDIAKPLRCSLGRDAQSPILRIVVAQAALVDLAKAGLPKTGRPPPLGDLSQALSLQGIALAAHVGRCSLTLAEFAGLGVGDVLVFDRSADAPLGLFVNGVGRPVARCGVAQGDDRLDLILLDSIDG